MNFVIFPFMKFFIDSQIKFHWTMYLLGLIDNHSALVEVMVWRRTGDKPLPFSMSIHCIHAYMLHSASVDKIDEHLLTILSSSVDCS